MPHFDKVVIIDGITDEDIFDLKDMYGHRVRVTVRWSYNGEILDCPEEDVDKINDDEDLAERILGNSNLRL